MSEAQKLTKFEDLDPIDQEIVLFTAAKGARVEADGEIVKETVDSFARRKGFKTRQVIYDRRNAIPRFWELVDECGPVIIRKQMPSVYYAQIIKARSGGAGSTEAAKFLAEQAEIRKLPTQKSEITVTNIDEALA